MRRLAILLRTGALNVRYCVFSLFILLSFYFNNVSTFNFINIVFYLWGFIRNFAAGDGRICRSEDRVQCCSARRESPIPISPEEDDSGLMMILYLFIQHINPT